MTDPVLSASALVRDVADERMTIGDKAFAYGFSVIIGGGTVVMIAASLLRVLGCI